MYIHWAQGSLVQVCKMMHLRTAGGQPLPSGGSGGKTGTRRGFFQNEDFGSRKAVIST